MRVFDYRDVPLEEVEMAGCKGVKVRWLLRTEHGAEKFWMRVFEVEPGGYTPLHRHPWEHEVFVLEGEGTVVGPDGEVPIRPGTVVFVAPNELHQFKNTGEEMLKFICLVPAHE
ncbi:MAG TPA: cupin domain-containing protein [Candidatus Bathyarchaeota archaeon]|nr:cupin domain-containing protein [Candidatus Bathyarchaeota archaeon]